MQENPFLDWLVGIAADRVTTDALNVHAEAVPNMRSFSLTRAQAAVVGTEHVADFIRKVLRLRSILFQHRGLPAEQMVFYCWHDDQAGQLKFSMVSACHGVLPFGIVLQQVENVETIIESWLTSPHLHATPRQGAELADESLSKVDSEFLTAANGEPRKSVLEVWTASI
jgi:hypothetical protein